MKAPRIYLDTSVIGGCEDKEFREASRRLLRDAAAGRIFLLISGHMLVELNDAPPEVKRHLADMDDTCMEIVHETKDSLALRDKYLEADILGPASINDALHVTIATVARADLLASWNFKHIVHYDKARQFNAVNLLEGYGMLEIRSPMEIAAL